MASKYRKKFEMPEGFYNILENYTREVLRDQPIDILEYSYLYFKHLDEVIFKQSLIFLIRVLWTNLIILPRVTVFHLQS